MLQCKAFIFCFVFDGNEVGEVISVFLYRRDFLCQDEELDKFCNISAVAGASLVQKSYKSLTSVLSG